MVCVYSRLVAKALKSIPFFSLKGAFAAGPNNGSWNSFHTQDERPGGSLSERKSGPRFHHPFPAAVSSLLPGNPKGDW